MEKIKLNNSVFIYKLKLDYHKNDLIKEILYNMEFNDDTHDNDLNVTKNKYSGIYPGIQSNIIINSKNLEKLKIDIVSLIKKYCYNNEHIDYQTYAWSYVSKNDNKDKFYHVHNKQRDYEWTYVFYVQMPDNLIGDDGKIFFKINELEYSLLPEEGDLLIFPSDLLHTPEPNQNSTLERIVIAGNFMKIDVEKQISKRKKSLI